MRHFIVINTYDKYNRTIATIMNHCRKGRDTHVFLVMSALAHIYKLDRELLSVLQLLPN